MSMYDTVNDNRVIVYVKGLSSPDSVREVAEALLGVEGVLDVEMDEEQPRALVELVEGVPMTSQDLMGAVESAGYHVERIDMPAQR